MLPGWSIFRPWPTSRGKTKCFIWAADLIMGSMAFCISGGKQYRQQRAAFWAGLCICRQHCAVNGINVRKIIRCLLLPQFAVRHPDSANWHSRYFDEKISPLIVLNQDSLIPYFLNGKAWSIVPYSTDENLKKQGLNIYHLLDGPSDRLFYYLVQGHEKDGAAPKQHL